MSSRNFSRLADVIVVALCIAARPASSQTPPAPEPAQQERAAVGSLFSPREGSGTSWLPGATPMYGFHRLARGWEVMLHGNGFLQLLHEAAPEHRGATQAGSINWAMAMARRPAGVGWFGARAMISLEPLTIPGCGYPNLLATGELCEGDNIHDRQHPHDLFMELAAEVDRPATASLRWQVYAGLAGEPALGPVAFPHRTSAMSNPLSPIAHHWLDATHITFGVITGGLYTSRWKAEASIFNGREPDENRVDLNLARLDSVAGRFSFAPADSLVMQVSAGRLNEAEMANLRAPRVDVDRVTASASYHRRFGQRNLWATSVAWGANREHGSTTHGGTLETSTTFSDRHTWFGRLEVNGKEAHDLHVHESDGVFIVGKVQAGYTRYLEERHGLASGVGASVSAALVPEALRARYGGVGLGVGLFLTLRPAAHEMASLGASGTSAQPGGHVMVQTAFDPAKLSCSPPIDPATAATTTYAGRLYYFCSARERDEFLKDPAMSLTMMPPKE